VIKFFGKVILGGEFMPNIKSSIRSVKTDSERRAANGPVKAEVRSTARKVEAQAAAGKKDEAQATLKVASGLLDKAARKGTIHKKAAARKKSRLAKKVNAVE
jgi:small subunit ribosomal protein S20